MKHQIFTFLLYLYRFLFHCKKNKAEMDIQRIRNMTTGILHTELPQHIIEDINRLVGVNGANIRWLPQILAALEPYLKDRIQDERFWNASYDPEHNGKVKISPMDETEKRKFFSCLVLLMINRKQHISTVKGELGKPISYVYFTNGLSQ